MRRRGVNSLVARYGTWSAGARALARWSARGLVAPYLLFELSPAGGKPAGLADSLARSLSEAVACAAETPAWVAIAGLIIARYLLGTALVRAFDAELIARGAEPGHLRDSALELSAPRWRPLRRGLIYGGLTAAILSGAGSVAIAGYAFKSFGRNEPLLAWAAVVTASVLITGAERTLTHRWYASHEPGPEPPTAAAAAGRLSGYVNTYPAEASSGSALFFAYSDLDREGLMRRFIELGSAGGLGKVNWLAFVVLVATFYSVLPAGDVDVGVWRGSFLGCTFADLHGFFGVARDNLHAAALAALAALAITPVLCAWAYHEFMHEWSFPWPVRVEVFRREWGFCLRMTLYSIMATTITSGVSVLVLWLAAATAARSASPLAGLTVLGAGWTLAYLGVTRAVSLVAARIAKS